MCSLRNIGLLPVLEHSQNHRCILVWKLDPNQPLGKSEIYNMYLTLSIYRLIIIMGTYIMTKIDQTIKLSTQTNNDD